MTNTIAFQPSKLILTILVQGLCRTSLGTAYEDNACIIRTKNYYPGTMSSKCLFVSFQNHLIVELICL